MSAQELERAKREAEASRARLESTLGTLQQRLKPKTLVNDAWEGVRDKSSDIADEAMQAVKERPGMASAAVAAFVVFLARNPLRKAATHIFSGKSRSDLVTTKITVDETNYEPSAPLVTGAAAE
jgi:ElaB/YqjD/DUF883 family membrane-anchored ribosome-binding protein